MKSGKMELRPEFVPWDIEIARINFGANCGPASFAAATDQEVCRTMKYFRHFEHSRSTNLTQMTRAFFEAGYTTQTFRCRTPDDGVALIQWQGPWTRKQFFSRWSLIYTHWIAVRGERVFDHTTGTWQSLAEWEQEVVPSFLSQIHRATGWAVKYGVGIIPSKNISFGLGSGSPGSSSLEPASSLFS